MTNREFATVLRFIAEKYEENENLPQLVLGGILTDKKGASEFIRSFRRVQKEYSNDTVCIKYEVNDDLSLYCWMSRKEVCIRKVIGTRVVPERIEEIVEWECKEPILDAIND